MQQTADIILTQTICFDDFKVSLTNTNMYYVHVQCDVEVTLDDAKQILNAMSSLQSQKKIPALIFFDNFSLPSKEAREYLAPKNASPLASADAYVLKNAAQKLVGNFYLKVNKPERPTRIFTDIDKAINWLEDFK